MTNTRDIASLLLVLLCATGAVRAECPSSYSDISGKCFRFLDTPLDWSTAEAICEGDGGHLAVLDDCALFGSVVDRINALGFHGRSYWLGATDVAVEGIWLWITGGSVKLGVPFWGQTGGTPEPQGGISQNCLYMFTGDRHYFHDVECTTAIPYPICQAAALSVATAVDYSASRDSAFLYN